MATTFPRVRGRRLGYRPEEVEAFLQGARQAYDGAPGVRPITAETIRTTAFSMAKRGYVPAAVDSALERLEDAFAARERERYVAQAGQKAWFSSTRTLAKEIIARLARPQKERFDRVGLLAVGYRMTDVDRFADRVSAYFEQGSELTVEEVRSIAFRAQRHGYREAQVDLLVDGVVQVMLAVR